LAVRRLILRPSPKSWPRLPDCGRIAIKGRELGRYNEPMEQSELLTYLRSQRLGVLGTLAPLGEPQAALVGYAVTPISNCSSIRCRPLANIGT
jgi:hypothetical protein